MIPQDPMILLSYINTQLRDQYASLDELCIARGISRSEIEEKLKSIDYLYDSASNRFV